MNNKNKSSHLPFFGIGKLIPFLGKYKKKTIIMVIFGLICSGIDIIWPVYNSFALDHFVKEGTLKGIGWFVLVYAFTTIMASVLNYVSCAYAMQVEVNINKDLRTQLLNIFRPCHFLFLIKTVSVIYIHG